LYGSRERKIVFGWFGEGVIGGGDVNLYKTGEEIMSVKKTNIFNKKITSLV